MQTPNKTVRAVCFSPEKKSQFDLAQATLNPVMIDKYRVNMRAGQENIIFDCSSILRDSTIDRTTFQPTVVPDNLTISQISQVAPEQIITSLKAKLVALKPTKRFQTAKGHFTKQEGYIADPTGTFKIIFWGDYCDQLTESTTYVLKRLRLKTMDGQLYLNTPKGDLFSFNTAEPFVEELPQVDHLDSLNIVTSFISVLGVTSVTKLLLCISCKKKVDIHNPRTAQCSSCGMKQKLSSAVIHWFVKLYCQHCEEQDIQIHLTCTHFTLQNFPQLADVDFCSITEEELTDELLLVDSVKVTYDKFDKKIIDVLQD